MTKAISLVAIGTCGACLCGLTFCGLSVALGAENLLIGVYVSMGVAAFLAFALLVLAAVEIIRDSCR